MKTVEEAIPAIQEFLVGKEAAGKVALKFEIRGRTGSYSINKKGDPEYRKLKTFDTAEEARTFINNNREDLVAAWEDLKNRDNVKKTDVRGEENRPRVGKDRRNGKDATVEMFSDTFGFKGGVFGKWVSQGKGNKDRQGMLNQAFDAFSDLADILGVPPKAMSLNGTLGLSFGASGHGWASAHYSPTHIAINLTKTRGAGALAHEFFHALDNYFSHQRGGEVAFTGDQQKYREDNYVTYKPEPMMVNKQYSGSYTRARLAEMRAANPQSGYLNNQDNWIVDPNHREGVRPEVEVAFADLVEALNNSPMTQRARRIDKTGSGYWSRIIERAARSFENYVIEKMAQGGYQNDYLANVVDVANFQRDKGRYPYLLPEEIKPIEDAFDNLFSTIKTRETDKGVALYSTAPLPPNQQATLEELTGPQRRAVAQLQKAGKLEVITAERARQILENAGMSRDEAVKYMVAWHGSPHDHDGFRSDKIGTGEGAQAYGYGHYFAGAKEVAEYYRKALSRGPVEITMNGRRVVGDDIYASVMELLYTQDTVTKDDVIKDLEKNVAAYGYSDMKRSLARIKASKSFSLKATKPKGRLYQVDLAPTAEEYLDWDKPLSEQSEFVRKALEKAGFSIDREKAIKKFSIDNNVSMLEAKEFIEETIILD